MPALNSGFVRPVAFGGRVKTNRGCLQCWIILRFEKLMPQANRCVRFQNIDVCAYGATASGVMATVAAAEERARGVVIEPSRWLGGMTGGWLMHIDWGQEQAVGGTARGILKRDYNNAQYALKGKVALQGGNYSMLYLEEAHEGIYKIPYRAITPRQEECTNLLVPVCVSASHIAMTSIRMEPVWMILGESAGVAASMAVKESVPVQQIEYAKLRTKLRDLKQKLERSA